jgi:DNA-binding transcriptional LysR family regulator
MMKQRLRPTRRSRFANNTWRISDQAVRHKLLLAGLGWCGMPEPTVRADIELGRAIRLNLAEWRGGEYTMHAVHNIDTPPGRAGRLADREIGDAVYAIEPPAQEITKPVKGSPVHQTASTLTTCMLGIP